MNQSTKDVADGYATDADYNSGLTDWVKEPPLADLKNDMQMGKNSHDLHVKKIDRWNDLLRVEGSAKPKKVKGRSSVQPKLIRRQAEWRYSALTEPFLGTDALFKLSPRTFEDKEAAIKNGLLLNYQFDTKINKVKFIDDFVRSVVDDGTCVVRVGWVRSTRTVKKSVPVYEYYSIEGDEESSQNLLRALNMRETDPTTYEMDTPPELKAAVEYYDETGQQTSAEVVGSEEVEVEEILENHPEAQIMDPRNVIIDPGCNGDIDKALFGVYSFETNKAELQKSATNYQNLDKVMWDGSTPLSQPDHETTSPEEMRFKDTPRKKVIAYEYWGFYDIDGNGELTPIVVTWINNTVIRMERNPFPDQKLPFVLVPYLPVKREMYGEPDAELLEDNQRVHGAVMRGMIDLLGRSANSQQGFAKGMLDPLNRRRFEGGQDYEFNPNLSVAQGLIQHKYPELPQSAMMMLNLQNGEAEALTGVKSFSGGMSGEAYGKVAAGIRGMLDAASKREMAILRRLARGMTQIGKKFMSMSTEFLSDEEIVRVTNMNHQTKEMEYSFEKIARDELPGNFDVKIDISTAEVDEAQAQKLAFVLQTTGQTMGTGLMQEIMSEICRLYKMPDLAQSIKSYKPEPDPLEKQLKQLQIEEQQLKNEKLRSEAVLNAAKAEHEEAETDKTEYETMEKGTGVEHTKNMEQARAQATGNQDLELTKAAVRPRKEGESEPDLEAGLGLRTLSGGPPGG